MFASTEAGRGRAIEVLVFTEHGGNFDKHNYTGKSERHDVFCHAVPAIPTLTTVERLSGQTARVVWVPLTPDEARGILTLLEIIYYDKPSEELECTFFDPTDSRIAHIEEKLFKQTAANITGLIPNHEYCVAIQVSTSAGNSGFNNLFELPRKLF